jgi:hypothetical protein
MNRVSAAAIAVAIGVSLAAEAKDDTINRHKGFFLRLDAEPGYLSSSATQAGTSATISGWGGGIGIGIGGALTEDLILFGHIYDVVASNPSVSSGGSSVGTSNTSLGIVGYGVGLCYYVMPANVYLSGTLAIAVLTAESNGNRSNSQAGPGGRLAIGKEWWVSDHWGLGAAAQLSFGFNKDNANAGAPTWTTWAPSLAFSATFN